MKIKLNMRSTLGNNLVIYDHPKLLIFISPGDKKILSLPKDEFLDKDIFQTQNRMFDYFITKGIMDPAGKKGGAIYKSMEGIYFDSTEYKPLEIVLKVLSDFLEVEKEYHDSATQSYKIYQDQILNPDEEETTELGEIPSEFEKGRRPNNSTYSDTFWGYNL
jgi:hypothetical protein